MALEICLKVMREEICATFIYDCWFSMGVDELQGQGIPWRPEFRIVLGWFEDDPEDSWITEEYIKDVVHLGLCSKELYAIIEK